MCVFVTLCGGKCVEVSRQLLGVGSSTMWTLEIKLRSSGVAAGSQLSAAFPLPGALSYHLVHAPVCTPPGWSLCFLITAAPQVCV